MVSIQQDQNRCRNRESGRVYDGILLLCFIPNLSTLVALASSDDIIPSILHTPPDFSLSHVLIATCASVKAFPMPRGLCIPHAKLCLAYLVHRPPNLPPPGNPYSRGASNDGHPGLLLL
jgi:hypothetical protein